MSENGGVKELSTAVLGAGLIGGSAALALRNQRVDLKVWDQSDRVRAQLIEMGFDAVPETLKEAVQDAELVIVATPLLQMVPTVFKVLELATPGVVVTDVGSIKSPMSRLVGAHHTSSFVPSHPMAGKAMGGYKHADPLLFQECTWVICDQVWVTQTSGSESRAVLKDVYRTELIVDLAKLLGAGKVVMRDPIAHDRQVAAVSHLPQLLVSTIASQLDVDSLADAWNKPVAAALRLASSPDEMWVSIATENKHHIQDAIRDARRYIDDRDDVVTTSPGGSVASNVAAMSVVLRGTAEARESGTLELAGGGFRDSTSMHNFPVGQTLGPGLANVRGSLLTLSRALDQPDELRAMMRQARSNVSAAAKRSPSQALS